MKRLTCLLGAITVIGFNLISIPATAADMTFQWVNDTEREVNLKLFSRSESHQQWPSKTKAYSIKPDSAPQQITITCEEGEQVCWGAWITVQTVSGEIGASGQRTTRTSKYSGGAGERGQRPCSRCCHVCKAGAVTPLTSLRDPDPMAK